jgi:hypothetical protein
VYAFAYVSPPFFFSLITLYKQHFGMYGATSLVSIEKRKKNNSIMEFGIWKLLDGPRGDVSPQFSVTDVTLRFAPSPFFCLRPHLAAGPSSASSSKRPTEHQNACDLFMVVCRCWAGADGSKSATVTTTAVLSNI